MTLKLFHMKKYILLSFSICLLIFQTSCELTETNIDPTKIDDTELRFLLPAAISQTAFNQTNTTLRVAGSLIQQFRMEGACGAFADYVITPRHFDNYWATGLYGGSLKDCQVIIDKAREQGQDHYEGIAKMLMAKELGNSSLMFGDLPVSEALDGLENLQPAFDTQEEVMKTVFQLLDDAIALLEQEPVAGGPASDDRIFGGDAQAWLKTAWALKARYHMQMSRRDPDAASKVLNALDNAFSSLAEQPNFQWGSNENEASPLAQFGTERRNTMGIDKRFAEKFLEDDPRLPKYAFFQGSYWEYFNYANPSYLHWSKPDALVPIISYVELAFLKTEALWHSGAGAASLQNALEDAVAKSMQQVELGVSDYQDYMDSLASLATMSREEQLEYIMVEAYKAFYGYAGLQTWSNYRRNGYPNLQPASRGSHGLNPEGGIPKRYLYPENEQLTNPENMAIAKERQGGALMDAPLWIFK
jgi:hypothetical protein